jgi:hypothetical protein
MRHPVRLAAEWPAWRATRFPQPQEKCAMNKLLVVLLSSMMLVSAGQVLAQGATSGDASSSDSGMSKDQSSSDQGIKKKTKKKKMHKPHKSTKASSMEKESGSSDKSMAK